MTEETCLQSLRGWLKSEHSYIQNPPVVAILKYVGDGRRHVSQVGTLNGGSLERQRRRPSSERGPSGLQIMSRDRRGLIPEDVDVTIDIGRACQV